MNSRIEKLIENSGDTTFRDYRPYQKIKVVNTIEASHTEAEKANMEGVVTNILDKYTLKEYFCAKGGMQKDIDKITKAINKSGISFEGKRILEFGAGTCKLSATISSLFDVEEIWVLDQTENLLREIAPRIISALGGDINKFTFAIGDMNTAFKIKEKFDAVVCFGAVHHLYLPEYFFEKIDEVLNPNGIILIVDEPTLPRFNSIPFTQAKNFKKHHFAKKRIGENENAYTIKRYKEIFGDKWNTKLITVSPLKTRLYQWLSINYFMTNYLLKLKTKGKESYNR